MFQLPGQEGLQDVTVVASNQSGSDAQSFQINVAPSASGPTFTSTPVAEAEAGKQYTYQVTVSGTPPVSYTLAEKPQGMIIEPGRGTVLWTPTRAQAGPHPVRITATNSAGTSEQSFTLEVYKIPIISVIPNQRIAPDKPFWYQAEVDARPAPAFAINAAPAGLAIHPESGLLTWTPTSQQLGTHTVLFEATNRFGRGQQSFEVEVDGTVDATPVPSAGAFRILPHYPQPAVSVLTVPVQLAASSSATIDLHDALGRLVETQHGSAAPGSRLSFSIATARLQPGVYLYRVRSGGEQQYRSFLVAR